MFLVALIGSNQRHTPACRPSIRRHDRFFDKHTERLCDKENDMKSAWLVAALVTAAAQGKSGTTNPPVPVIFAPGIISGPSNDGSPTFSPDGKTLLFERSYAAFTVIFEARRIRGGHWSRPAPAIFSGPTADQQPSFSPDGSYLIYASIRLISGGDGKSTQSHLYRVDRTTDGWGTPKELPATVNFARRMFKPSVARNGEPVCNG
jgi:hypothetical protein